MPTEIERKFVVVSEDWRAHMVRSVRYRQGYLANNARCSVRVRVAGKDARLNIKSAGLNVRRAEYEYRIPPEEADEMLDALCEHPLIEKVRHDVRWMGWNWEVDVFEGENAGLVVAEIELEAEDQAFPLPPWVGPEVSHDARYYNVNLVTHPYSRWGTESASAEN
ncbi:MAG TPA: CYTH domain-containing protein [Chromatiales bacterium]|nr:CYTH domain-containing protein [Chromatiales bacterium]